MNPDIERMLAELAAITAEGTVLCADLSDAQFNRRPAPGRWSIAECLVHLNISVSCVLPALDAALAAGHARGPAGQGHGPFRYGWVSRWIIRSMEPPPRFRMRTVPKFRVPQGAAHAVAAVLPEFLTVREQFAERVRRADGLDLTAVRVISPRPAPPLAGVAGAPRGELFRRRNRRVTGAIEQGNACTAA